MYEYIMDDLWLDTRIFTSDLDVEFGCARKSGASFDESVVVGVAFFAGTLVCSHVITLSLVAHILPSIHLRRTLLRDAR